MKWLPALVLCLLPSALWAQDDKDLDPPNPSVAVANQVLAQAGLPALPAHSVEMKCYAWRGLSSGVYAFFELEKEEFDDFLTPYLGMEQLTPIPDRLLAPPNAAAAWFDPGSLTNGTVFFRGRITQAAPELFRLYVDSENYKIFLYYTWNNKRGYP